MRWHRKGRIAVIVLVAWAPLLPAVHSSMAWGSWKARHTLFVFGQPVPYLIYDWADPHWGASLVRFFSPLALLFCLGMACLLAWAASRLLKPGQGIAMRIACMVILGIGIAASFGGYRSYAYRPTLQKKHGPLFIRQAIEEIEAFTADRERLSLHLRRTKPSATYNGIGQRVLVFQDGDWLAYKQESGKSNPCVGDHFVATGADGTWVYSSSHFCIDMLMAHMDAPFLTRSHFLQTDLFTFTIAPSPQQLVSTLP